MAAKRETPARLALGRNHPPAHTAKAHCPSGRSIRKLCKGPAPALGAEGNDALAACTEACA